MKEPIGLAFFEQAFYPSRLQARGDALYFIGKRASLQDNAYHSDIYRLQGGEAVPLTQSRDVRDFALLDGGILFPSLRDAKDKEAAAQGEPLTVFHLLPWTGGEAREHLRLPYQVEQFLPLPGGGLLFRAVHDLALDAFLKAAGGSLPDALKAKRQQDETLAVLDELPFWYNGEGFRNKRRAALYLHDGHATRRLTGPYDNAGRVALSPDGAQALLALDTYEHVQPMTNRLCLLDLATGSLAPLPGIPEGFVEDYAFGGDGRAWFLLHPADAPHGPFCGNPALCSVGLADAPGPFTVHDDSGAYDYGCGISSDMKLGIQETPLTPVGDGLLFLSTLGDSSHLLRYSLPQGGFTQVTQAPGAVAEFIPWGDAFAAIAMRGNGLCELYRIAPDGGEVQLSQLNTALLDAHEVVTPVPLTFQNAQGVDIQGWVMPPADYVPGKLVPTILNIHGGPKSAYGAVFFHEMQYWCAQGYAVIYCNPTGSEGRGSAFADIRGRYGTVDYEDIMAFVDAAEARFGFISAGRCGVTGGSYGGFMTNWIIGHTDRFRAAVSQRSISNWLGFACTSDIGYTFGRDQMDATPWDGAERLWEASPLKYADRVRTPTLFIHSEEDYRCNQFEGIQMFYALRQLGVQTRLCLFKGENHELSRSGKPKSRVRRLEEITRWMDLYLKGV